ncbi:hypothetical protein BDW69DRAFT_200981 [Aspergillus filifer]
MFAPTTVDVGLASQSDSGRSAAPNATPSEAGSTSPSSITEDPVCIVGMACRLPGQISSPSDLWKFLSNNLSAQCDVPPERFNIDAYYSPDGSRSGAINAYGGYFLQEDVRNFDNSFFGINNIEATYMDPQQRKLLEVVFECFEDAGATLEGMSGSCTGVYVGNFTVDYSAMQTRDPDYLHRFVATGSGTAIMSNRISHVFNLQGPSMTLDTACSSAIYALHHAVTALQAGDCDSAIVAGANLITSPEQHMGTMKGGFLSPTSTCHTFDTSADGYGRAEAVNAIYVKRLSTAIRDGDNIRAIVRGSAVNSDGHTPGITLPSADAQEKVIRRAYGNAGLDFADTDYVECHGTGTAVGDPIEVDALSRCFAPRPGQPVLIGSVKTNLGHSEAASGLTSIMKVVTAFEHGAIPPTHGVVNINPALKLEDRNMQIVRDLSQWPRALRRASVNSFGYGGSNAHVVLEAVDPYWSAVVDTDNEREDTEHDDQIIVLPVSAASRKSLDVRIEQLTSRILPACNSAALRRLASTLCRRRSQLRVRKFLLAKTTGPGKSVEIVDAPEPTEAITVNSGSPLPFAFIFTGQGAQYPGMAKELLLQNTEFRNTILSLDSVLQSLSPEHKPDWTLCECILDSSKTSRVNEVTRSQPLCTAIQIGLVDVLRNWGVTPAAVVGHSSGEIGAAYASGLLSASQAILAAYFRGFAVEKLQSQGAMMAAGLDHGSADQLIEEKKLTGRVRVACVNAPESVTISGESDDIDILLADLKAKGKFSRRLVTGGRAYHSHMMAEIGDLYESLLRPYMSGSTVTAAVTMFSSVGQNNDSLRIINSNSVEETDMPAYWRENLEQPVQFSAALAKLAASGQYQLIELGPHAALKGPVKQIRTAMKKDEKVLPYAATLVRNQNADLSMKVLAGKLFSQGHEINWSMVHCWDHSLLGLLNISSKSFLSNLPAYPWDYSATEGKLWYEPRASAETRNRKHVRHELLGTAGITGNGINFTWRNILNLAEIPWLKDHRLEDQIVFPAAGYMAVAMEGIAQVQGMTGPQIGRAKDVLFEFQDVKILEALLVPDDAEGKTGGASDHELHTILSPADQAISTASSTSASWYGFAISSWVSGQTTTHCTGRLRVMNQPNARQITSDTITVPAESRSGYEFFGTTRWYDKWKSEGLVFGPAFQSLTSLHADGNRTRTDGVITTQLIPPFYCTSKEAGAAHGYFIHPVTIDACFQAGIMGGTAGVLSQLRAFMPVSIDSCRISIPAGADLKTDTDGNLEAEIHTASTVTGISTRRTDCTMRAGPQSHPVINFRGVRMAQYTSKSVTRSIEGSDTGTESARSVFDERHPCLDIQWKPDLQRVVGGSSVAQDALREYIASYVKQKHEEKPDLLDSNSLPVIAALVDLAGHRLPRMRVLEVGLAGDDCDCRSRQLLDVLHRKSAFPRCQGWYSGEIDAQGEVNVKDGAEGPFDLVVVPLHSTSKTLWQLNKKISDLLNERGVLIARASPNVNAGVEALGLVPVDVGQGVVVAVRPTKTGRLHGRRALIVTNNAPSQDVLVLAEALISHLATVAGVSEADIVSIEDLSQDLITPNTITVSLLEAELEFLASISPVNMDKLRLITDTVTDLLWITGANMLGSAPDATLTLASGLSRALIIEQPSLRFSLLDIGRVTESPQQEICNSAIQALSSAGDADDNEFILHNGLLNISRFAPANDQNRLFRQRLDQSEAVPLKPLRDAGIAELAIGQAGDFNSLHFQQLSPDKHLSPLSPPAGYVDVELRAVSLHASNVHALSGRFEARHPGITSSEFGGVITAVGDDVENLRPGDRIVAFAPTSFATIVRLPATSVHLLQSHENMAEITTLLTDNATALHAIKSSARLRPGETVLVHAEGGAFDTGSAAIALAKRLGGVVYAVVGAGAQREYLVKAHMLPASHIFEDADGESLVANVLEATGGRGVDVVVQPTAGSLDLRHASRACLATFGRLVEVQEAAGDGDDSALKGRLAKNATVTSVDLVEMFFAEDEVHRDTLNGIVSEVLTSYRAGHLSPTAAQTYDDRTEKIVISLETKSSLVPLAPALYTTTFHADKVYLLVGCLGGLGRSLSRWMMARGARRFVFLGRSGADKPRAHVGVVRGDVSRAEDVRAAVDYCAREGHAIGGVVQAAMGLHEALFTRMAPEAWHTGIDPKYIGTWNIHQALEQGNHDANLDFFLLTSSVSGSVGTATESNYCAANGFLDAFAKWRRAQGKPAVSVGLGMISEVGYLHENPEIEALLLRKGIHPLNEEEFLQVVDLALTPIQGPGKGPAHILTGLEGISIRTLQAQGFDVNNSTMQDPRGSLISASLLASQEALSSSDASQSDSSQSLLSTASTWFHSLPTKLKATFTPECNADTLHSAILNLIRRRFSNLIMMPAEHVEDTKPMPQFGVDSMLASEFRSWFWSAFGVDVSFLTIMSSATTLGSLAGGVEAGLGAVIGGGEEAGNKQG